jgi:predicted HTH transcriptional regulator
MAPPPLPSDAELAILETFPYMEGFQYEFKESVISTERLLQNLCAFLNGKGGWLILGIRDIDRAMSGIPDMYHDKMVDCFILRCDNVFHQRLIISEDGMPVATQCIQARSIVFGKRRFVFVRIEPEEGKTYVCHDGSKYIRLSASNYKFSCDRYYTSHDMSSAVMTAKVKTRKEFSAIIDDLEKDMMRTEKRLCGLEKELETTRRHLCDKILTEKTDAENRLRQRGIMCCVFSWLW